MPTQKAMKSTDCDIVIIVFYFGMHAAIGTCDVFYVKYLSFLKQIRFWSKLQIWSHHCFFIECGLIGYHFCYALSRAKFEVKVGRDGTPQGTKW